MDDEEKVSSATLHTPDTIKPHIDKSDVETTKEVVLEWSENDPEHPFNWSPSRKYAIVLAACYLTALTAANSTCMAILATWGPDWFHTSRIVFMVGAALYNIAVSTTPLILAPISEHLGRNEIYQVTSIINAILFLPQILSHNISGFLAARWFQGMVSSVGISMVGGTIADLFQAKERGPAMNLFSLIIFFGQAAGGLTMGWVGQRTGFQWCFGAIAAGVSIIVNALVLRETRAEIILKRKAKRLTKETGIKHVLKGHQQHKGFFEQLRVTAVRPMKFLFTEPIVSALSIWIGFAWAIIFLGGTATILVFQQYGFDEGQVGSVQATIAIGGIIGYLTNFHQEKLYKRAAARSVSGRAAPEARLYWAAFGGLLFPIGMMAFAWTGQPHIPWPVPALMLVISYWGIYCMYLGVFNYLADAYETYSSSAQAAQGFARNTSSGIFPLFARQMYVAMGYPHASTVVASIAFALGIFPFLLIIYGARLRARSPVTSSLVGALG